MITSVEPRALRPVASASDLRVVRPPSLPPSSAPPNLPTLATRITARVNSSRVGCISVRRSMPRPATAKNTGLKKAMMKPRSWPSICSVRIGDWPIRMPAMNAPSAVCTPISSVVSAIDSMTTRMAVITGTSIVMLSLTQTISRATSRRPTVRLKARNSAVPARLPPMLARSTVPWAAMPAITAMMTQAMVSSRIAVARMSWPMSRRMTPISISVMATIFTEEIDRAVPRNSAVTSGLLCDGMTSLGSA